MHDPSLIPRPAKIELRPGELELAQTSTLFCSTDDSLGAAALLRCLLTKSTGIELPSGSDEATVRFRSDSRFRREAYRLSVDSERILITAADPAGFFNAVQTLRQLFPAQAFLPGPMTGALAVRQLEIEDAPRFPWRGALLDVARHFFAPPFLFRFIDLLAMHKFNVLHLHLNDDQGWRFPCERYPRLVEIGAWRRATRIGHQRDETRDDPPDDGTPHGGYYTKEELRSLVSYGDARNVIVVPEIDLPGHAQAAIAAYPSLGNAGALEVATQWGVSDHVLNLSDETISFCREVWDEVLEVFPSEYVHIGGDECPRGEWQTASGRARVAALGLSGVDELQSWFTREVCAHLGASGRRPVGWDEILEGGPLPSGTTVMSWRGTVGGVHAARSGFDVLMCPEVPTYFDHYQSASPDEPLAIHGENTLEAVHGWNPIPAELDAEEARRVRGTQFQLWSEYLPHAKDIEYMAFPRALALAEVAWGTNSGGFAEFRSRVESHLERLDALGVNYRPLAGPLPWQRGGVGTRRRFDLPQH
jgi:hexosaminidase